MKNKSALSWIVVSVLIVALDQWSKYFVTTHFSEATTVSVAPFLNFILRFNDGAAFSFLGAEGGWQIYLLSAISISISLILIVWLYRIARSEWCLAIPLSFVLGGAVGNLIDRLRLGFVVDFIDFHVKNWHFATFNVADSFVCVGATLLVLRLFYESITRKS